MLPAHLAALDRRIGDANEADSLTALSCDLEQRWPADEDALALRRIATRKCDWVA